MLLTPKRPEVPGSLEVWLGGWWMMGTSLWRQGVGRRYGMWNSGRVDRGKGTKVWSVNKSINDKEGKIKNKT